MRGFFVAVGVLIAGVVPAGLAFAQEPPAAVRPVAWEVSGSVGRVATFEASDDPPTASRIGDTRFEVQVDVRKNLNQAVRIDLHVSTTTASEVSDFPTSNTSVDRRLRLHAIGAAVAYPLLPENVFAHPYLAAGLRLGFVPEDREEVTYPMLGQMWTPGVISHRTSVIALPYVAGGITNRLGERAFSLAEALTAFGLGGVAHVTLRAGIGVRF